MGTKLNYFGLTCENGFKITASRCYCTLTKQYGQDFGFALRP